VTFALLVIASVFFGFCYVVSLKVKEHTRGTGLGRRLAAGGESKEAQLKREERYIKGASTEARAKRDKYDRQARRTRRAKRREKAKAMMAHWDGVAKEHERIAKANLGKAGEKSHGIRRAGTEKGRPKL